MISTYFATHYQQSTIGTF